MNRSKEDGSPDGSKWEHWRGVAFRLANNIGGSTGAFALAGAAALLYLNGFSKNLDTYRSEYREDISGILKNQGALTAELATTSQRTVGFGARIERMETTLAEVKRSVDFQSRILTEARPPDVARLVPSVLKFPESLPIGGPGSQSVPGFSNATFTRDIPETADELANMLDVAKSEHLELLALGLEGIFDPQSMDVDQIVQFIFNSESGIFNLVIVSKVVERGPP